MLGTAAAAVDLMATAAVTAHEQRTGLARERPHGERVRVLERLEARFQDHSLTVSSPSCARDRAR